MNYIVLDLEFNQDFSSIQNKDFNPYHFPFEIIQIGGIKLDENLSTISTFNRFIKPTIYSLISPSITELTGITTDQLRTEETFPQVYKTFIDFIGDMSSIFCIWGMSDIKEIYGNVHYHKLDSKHLPKAYINIQPYISMSLGFPDKKMISLQNAVEAFQIPITETFHNALYDAFYTAELFKKIYHSSMHPKVYDSTYIVHKPRQPKIEIDFDKLIQQFEKMYARNMTDEEKDIIILAYKMGRTNQFIKNS